MFVAPDIQSVCKSMPGFLIRPKETPLTCAKVDILRIVLTNYRSAFAKHDSLRTVLRTAVARCRFTALCSLYQVRHLVRWSGLSAESPKAALLRPAPWLLFPERAPAHELPRLRPFRLRHYPLRPFRLRQSPPMRTALSPARFFSASLPVALLKGYIA